MGSMGDFMSELIDMTKGGAQGAKDVLYESLGKSFWK
jgi:hypothetical protein